MAGSGRHLRLLFANLKTGGLSNRKGLPCLGRCISTFDAQQAVSLSVPAFQVWGANTDVGKSLVSAGLMKYALQLGQARYLKPVQTGFPGDSDARFVGKVCGRLDASHGAHAAQLLGQTDSSPQASSNPADPSIQGFHTDFAWEAAVSPHLAVQREGRGVSDNEVCRSVLGWLQSVRTLGQSKQEPSLGLVETAGGPGSPGPSGRLQCDIFRPLRLPAVLVGDGKLGGISTTLSSYEMLVHRGYNMACVAVLEDDDGPNVEALGAALGRTPGKPCPVIRFPACCPPSICSAMILKLVRNAIKDNAHAPARALAEATPVWEKNHPICSPPGPGFDPELLEWLNLSSEIFQRLYDHLQTFHAQRVEALGNLPNRTLRDVWYPFTQHLGLRPEDISTIDARSGEHFLMVQGSANDESSPCIVPQFDACASWWTQGMAEELQQVLVSETMKGIARYGHVIHPMTVIEPTVQLAQILLDSVGKDWADKVFYSDDGSTAVEVALKMAFRKFWKDNPDINLQGTEGQPVCELKVIGIDGGYHGDTLGAMDAVAPSPYNGPAQYPWYTGRGLFLQAPYVGLTQGLWKLRSHPMSEEEQGWESLEDVFDASRQDTALAQKYAAEIEAAIERYQSEQSRHGSDVRLGACIIEPVLQGAGGMLLVDPVYQRTLVRVARARKVPVIFDEVFSGLWRLGRPSAAEYLGIQPDIACYAKLLTGGLLPLSATLASNPVFEAFNGPTKLDALLHGHSYSGHAAGASAAVAALNIFSNPDLNPALEPDAKSLKQLWPTELVRKLSHHERIETVVAIGTVFVAELKTGDGSGYASTASAAVVQRLRMRNIFARPLGSAVYLMVTPTTSPKEAAVLLETLLHVLEGT